MSEFQTVSEIIAERDALRAVNAELVDALEAMLDGNGYECLQGEWYWHQRCVPRIESLDKARAALAKAKELKGTE